MRSEQESYAGLGREVNLAAKIIRAQAERILARHGSSLTDWIVLRVVGQHPGCSQRELAFAIGIEGPTMTRHLDRMEADGLIERRRDERDRRVVRVTSTPRGETTLARLEPVMADGNKRLLRGIPRRDLATFRKVLERVVANAAEEESPIAAR